MDSVRHCFTVTEFKAKCLELFDRLSKGQIDHIEVTRRGRTVAIINPPPSRREEFEHFLESMKDSVSLPDDFDLVSPVFVGEINAEKGILHLDD